MSFSVSLESIEKLKKSKGLVIDGRVQRYVDAEVLRLMAPFTPFDTGQLQNNAYAKDGVVVYKMPYARYLYYGKVMVSPSTGGPWAQSGEKKVLTGRSLRYKGAPMRGAYWFLRMKAQYGQEILKGAGKRIGT